MSKNKTVAKQISPSQQLQAELEPLPVEGTFVETAIEPLKNKMKEDKPLKVAHAAKMTEISASGKKVLGDIEDIMAATSYAESSLMHSYVQLGTLLLRVSEGEYYRNAIDVPYDENGQPQPIQNFSQYIAYLAKKYNKGQRSLYYYYSTVKALTTTVPEDQLNKMGIEKAKALAVVMKSIEATPDTETIAAVVAAPNKEAVTALLRTKYNLQKTEPEAGTWYEIGFYLEDGDRLLFDQQFEKAYRIGNFPSDMPEWKKQREAMKMFVAEFSTVTEQEKE